MNLVVLVLSLAAVISFGDRLVKSVLRFSRVSGISELASGFILVSVATSAPELAVAVISGLEGDPLLSAGNIFGSNVANILLIMGLTLALVPVSFGREDRKEASVMVWTSVLVSIPVILIQVWWAYGLFCLYLFYAFCRRTVKAGYGLERRKPRIRGLKSLETVKSALSCLFYTSALVLASKFVVSSAVSLAEEMGIPESVIGGSLIGLGTSLPELSVALAAARRSTGILIGDVLGSVLTNSTLVLGFTLLASPVSLDAATRAMAVVSGLSGPAFLCLMNRGRSAGIAMVAAYLAFAGLLYLRFSPGLTL